MIDGNAWLLQPDPRWGDHVSPLAFLTYDWAFALAWRAARLAHLVEGKP